MPLLKDQNEILLSRYLKILYLGASNLVIRDQKLLSLPPPFHTLCMREAKAMTRQCTSADSSEPSLLVDAKSAKISSDGPLSL